MSDAIFTPASLDLSELVSTLLDKGVVLRGEAMISVADIDLIQLDLGLLLAAVESVLRRERTRPLLSGALGPLGVAPGHQQIEPAAAGRSEESGARAGAARASARAITLREVAPALPPRLNVDPEGAENGLARLALTLIEVLRKVLEHQAIRRMEGDTLSDAEVERLGQAMLRLHDRMRELQAIFGLSDEDLEIDLGPLGRLR